MKLFSQNLEILVPCCDVVIKFVQKESNLYICRTGGKNIRNRNHNNFGSKFFLSKDFVNPVFRSQSICLKVSNNSYFDPFVAICTWCPN